MKLNKQHKVTYNSKKKKKELICLKEFSIFYE